ncbi:MAG: putative chitinase [Sphingomonadales bacterium]|nr:putative chitinase [Sphingomonadales bacterium]
MENAQRAQQRLVAKGYAIKVDGDFGPASYAALLSFVGQQAQVNQLRSDLGKAMAKYFPGVGLDTPLRVAHALAQQSVETGGFSKLVENLNYSVAGLLSTFGTARISEADCQRLGRQAGAPALSPAAQEQIANIVYGGAFGKRELGNDQAGDGWKFRGRGAKQTTGRFNYNDVKTVTGIDVIGNPDLLADPDMAVQAACIFWSKKNCNQFADRDDILGLTKAVNGGTNGLPDRRAALLRAKAILL